MKKIMSGILVAGALLMTATPAFAAENTDEGVKTLEGKTKVEITDVTIDPITQLPTAPGVFTLLQVPDIDFGQIALDDVATDGSTVLTGVFKDLDGDGKNDLQIKDTRPTSNAEAQGLIDKYVADGGNTESQAYKDAVEAWANPELASKWSITAVVDAENDQVEAIADSMTINGEEVLETANKIVTETATAPVGTKSYLDQVSAVAPTLTLSHNNLAVKEYNGEVTYTAVLGE